MSINIGKGINTFIFIRVSAEDSEESVYMYQYMNLIGLAVCYTG